MAESITTGSARLGRHASTMAAGTLVSRVLGVVRTWMLIAAVGINVGAANAFDVANRAPNFLFAIIAGGVLNAVLVPQIVKAQRSANGQGYVDRLLTLAGVLILGITLVMTLGATVVIGLYIDNWSPQLTALAVAFGFWCIPQLFFYGLYTLLGQVLNAREHFGPFMWAPVLNNVVSIIGFGAFIAIFGRYSTTADPNDLSSWTGAKIALLAGTATLGVAAQALILLIPLRRDGFHWRPRWGFRGVGLGSAGKVAVWTFASLVLDQIGVLLVTRIASGAARASGYAIDVAGNAAYTNALMIYLLPHSLVTVSIATALFTRISAAAADGDVPAVRGHLSLGMRMIGLFTVFATLALAVLALPLTRVVLLTSSFVESVSVARILVAMLIGLVPLGAMVLMKWVYFAFEDGRTIFWIQVPMTLILAGGAWLGSLVLRPAWWVVGIGASMALSNLVAVLLRLAGLRRRLQGLDGTRILNMHVRAGLAALIAAAIGWGALHALGNIEALGRLGAFVACLGIGALMLGVYVALLRALRVRELQDLLDPVMARIRRR